MLPSPNEAVTRALEHRLMASRALSFFELFECQATIAAEGAHELHLVLLDGAEPRDGALRLRALREDGGIIARRCFEELHVRARTPFDHRAIERLTRSLEESLDALEAAAARVDLYRLATMVPEAERVAGLLREALTAIEDAVGDMRHVRHAPRVIARCERVVELTREVDRVVREARARRFKEEPDPLVLIQWIDVLDCLRDAAVGCRETARVIVEVVLQFC
jgi:uncharacterized protein Yka (UPF0111/DUF47 family)